MTGPKPPQDFDRALKFTLTWEGGRCDDPRDPGGRTAFGVTQRVYDAHCRACGKPQGDVWKITQADVAAIYRKRYWDVVTEGRPWPLNAVLFDAAVNCGPGRALKWLEEAKATVASNNPRRMYLLAAKVQAAREAYYRRLAYDEAAPLHWAFNGWMNRSRALRAAFGIK